MRRHEPPVGVAEEREVGDADHLRRGALLGLADLGHASGGAPIVEPAGLAARADAVRDLDAGVGPAGDASRRPEVDVVGMRGDHQDAFDVVSVASPEASGRAS